MVCGSKAFHHAVGETEKHHEIQIKRADLKGILG